MLPICSKCIRHSGFYTMKLFILLLLFGIAIADVQAQYAFELKVDYAMQIQNSDQYSVSGTLLTGRVENDKTYYLEDGAKLVVKNLMSSKTATSVPVAAAPESVSIGLVCTGYRPESGVVLRGISTRAVFAGSPVTYNANQMPEGYLSCKINGMMYKGHTISKPVYIRQSNLLDLFFLGEDESVIWLQINQFSDIAQAPHAMKSDTSLSDKSMVCKVAYMPKGYRPTDMPNHYMAYEDVKGNAGITITILDKYRKKIALTFSGILRANARMQADKADAGLFYITEGKVDNVSWDAF